MVVRRFNIDDLTRFNMRGDCQNHTWSPRKPVTQSLTKMYFESSDL